MKKIFVLFLLLGLSISVIGCSLTQSTTTTLTSSDTTTTTSDSSQTTTSSDTDATTISTSQTEVLDFYAINDFHGGAYTSIDTLSYIGNYLEEAKQSNPNSFFLTSGDIFQGTAFSNYYYGLPIVEILNSIGFSSFTLGNHEFDWGIDKIANYADGNSTNGEADFPFLAANIVYSSTNEPLEFTQPYLVIEQNGLRIGIIGVIGNVINSISASRVEGMTFLDPADTVYQYAEILRTVENCDVVIASIHDYDTSMNSDIAAFTGDHKVDAIFNGHSHTSVAQSISRSGVALPFAQASNYSNSVLTHIRLVFDRAGGKVTAASSEVLSEDDLYGRNTQIDDIITVFSTDTEYLAFVNEVLAYTPVSISKYDMPTWGASVLRDYAGVDIGILNSGGFRVNIDAGNITMGKLVEVYPFDNVIKTVYLDGQTIKDLYLEDSVVFDDAVHYSSGTLYYKGGAMNNSTLYLVGAVDYVFDKDYYPFLYGSDVQTTPFFMRDLLREDLLNTVGDFSPFNGSSYPTNVLFQPNYYYTSAFTRI